MGIRMKILCLCLLVVGGLPAHAAPAPPDRSEGVVEKALTAHCAKHGLKRYQIETCKLDLVPGRRVFRYRLSGTPKFPTHERYAVLFVDPKAGAVLALKLNSGDREEREVCVKQLLAAMKSAGKKVRSNREAEPVFRDLYRLGNWLIRIEPLEQKFLDGVTVTGPYRNWERTYGASGGPMPLTGAADFGMEVDAEGNVVGLLAGNVR
jgi:hypothetical protein